MAPGSSRSSARKEGGGGGGGGGGSSARKHWQGYSLFGKQASLNPPSDLKDRFDVIMVDEMQDLSESQFSWACAHAVAVGCRVVAVGDPCQRLYSFRYAMDDVPRALEEVCGEVGRPYAEFALTCSFRFGPKIAEQANWLLFVKEHSAQQTGKPRALTGHNEQSADIVAGTAGGSAADLSHNHQQQGGTQAQVTRIARTNIRLITWAIETHAAFPSMPLPPSPLTFTA